MLIRNEDDKKKAIELIAAIDPTIKPVWNMTLSKHFEKRTIDQNALYWLWLTCISIETGQDKNSLHKYFRGEFLGVDEKVIFGKTIHEEESTTKLNTKQFGEYLKNIQVFAATELSIILPEPEDQRFDEFKNHYENYL